ITATLETFPPPRRRLEVVHSNGFTVLDDTVGHPDSVNVVFEVAEALRPREVHVAFAVRGSRGARINRHAALALATWAKRVPIRTLVVTASDEAADERNRVQAREYSAFR